MNRLYGPMVPIATLRRLVAENAPGEPLEQVAERAGVSVRRLRTLVESVGFGTADKIVTLGLGTPGLWHTDPELAAIYESDAGR